MTNLRQQTILGIQWTSISTIISSLGQALLLIVLVRLLEDADFGLMAITNAVLGFVTMFINFGLSQAVIHKKEVTPEQLSTLFWCNILLSLAAYAFLILVIPPIADFFDMPKLEGLLLLASSSFIIAAIGMQHRALLQKTLAFQLLASLEIISFLAATITTLVLAWQGHGVYALVWGLLVQTFVGTVLVLWFGWRLHRIQFIFQTQSIHFFLEFGVFQTGHLALSYWVLQADSILIGKLLGEEVLGMYDVIKRILMKPARIVNLFVGKIMFPVMAKNQENATLTKHIYMKMLHQFASIGFPLFAFLCIAAESFIFLFLGEEWMHMTLIFQLISIAFAFRILISPMGGICLARGRADIAFYWNIGMSVFVPLMTYWGIEWSGVEGAAFSVLFIMLSTWFAHYFLVIRLVIPIGFKAFFKPQLILLLNTLAISPFIYIIGHTIEIPWIQFGVIGILILLFIGVLYYYLNPSFIKEISRLFEKNK